MIEKVSTLFQLAGRRVFVAGHRGMVGSALVRRLASEGSELLTVDRDTVDLRDQAAVNRWLAAAKPDVVFVAAATVGGIFANDTRPAEFLYDNLMIAANLIHGAWRAGVRKLMFLGSTCIYPRLAPQPMPEDVLLEGPLEPTNQWYAIAKIAGVKLCDAYRRQYGCDFISVIPASLYGPGDVFDPAASHVIPALIRRFHEAKEKGQPSVTIWGSGKPLREFLYVDDLADALVFLMKGYAHEGHINVGSGRETSIRTLAETVARAVGYSGDLDFDTTKPDGMPRKLADSTRLAASGWEARTDLEKGLAHTYQWYLANVAGTDRGRGHRDRPTVDATEGSASAAS